MTLGLSLSIALGAGIHIHTGPATLKRRFQAAWGRTEVFVAHATAWELTRERAWQHQEGWSLRFARHHQCPYGLRIDVGLQHPYGDLCYHRRSLLAAWDDAHQAKARHMAAYWLTQRVEARHVHAYAVTPIDPVARRFTASWGILDDGRLQAVVNTPEMTWQGRKIGIIEATLSCDEDSPVWMARIGIADLSDFAAIAIGDPITLALGLESFALIVDGKTLSRPSLGEQRMELTALSPVARFEAPFSGTIRYFDPKAVQARAAVEALIGPVDWQLPDWIIPPGRLAFENTTPLSAARAIVGAIGGLIESAPDGTVLCRHRHPVSIPQYDAATVDHSLFDADVIAAQASIAPLRGFNRVTIANEEGGSRASADRVEYIPDQDDAHRGTVRAYLATPRPVQLVHTGHPDTIIASLGAVTRTEIETLEFIDGQASTRYPVTAIIDLAWQHMDLGDVAASGQTLTAATRGYSLLRITYTTTSLDWRVALPIDEEVQFVLIDA